MRPTPAEPVEGQPDPEAQVSSVGSEDGTCPPDWPVKANARSGIFHVPDGAMYDRTRADRCYATPEAAEADGLRRSKR